MISRFVALFGLIAAGMISPASADDLRDAASKVSDCRSIADDAARLACLDEAALDLSLALEGSSVAPDWARAPEPRETPGQKASVAAPNAAADSDAEKKVPIWARVFQPGDDEDEQSTYEVTITRITRNNVGRHFFHTDDGQIWRQTIAEKVRPPKSLPSKAKIEQRSMGNPGLRFVDGPSGEYTVRRVE